MSTSQNSNASTAASPASAVKQGDNADNPTQTKTQQKAASPATKSPARARSAARPTGKAIKQTTVVTDETKPTRSSSQHIADQIRVFPRNRVWPD
ncbi:hypothetical protein [Thiomicrorhabdus sp.]|uniref:hypothetical protein n=1 Tax=Thiomicrorhabdus sp. TaxID=2039724 RepID=UPI0029C69DEC|nr:hypothetical protein [Thiomicrorhabdus sp.]